MINIPVDEPVTLPTIGSWPESVHLFDQNSVDAITAAYYAQRPLLVRGEPGTGKSQLARAAAAVLKRAFISTVVHARSESQDLQWEFDAVARLGEAQALGVGASKDEEAVAAKLDARNYLIPGPLWWALDWNSALEQTKNCQRLSGKPHPPEDWQPSKGCVLLIDEIDKAEADLPNGLLETLGNGAFPVPWLDEPVGLKKDIPAPLVIITTNEERELPSAFLRRCLVLHLDLPNDEEELKATLVRRGGEHFKADKKTDRKGIDRGIREQAADLLIEHRRKAKDQDGPTPGQAEYLDILRALHSACPDDVAEQKSLLARIAPYALIKAPGEL